MGQIIKRLWNHVASDPLQVKIAIIVSLAGCIISITTGIANFLIGLDKWTVMMSFLMSLMSVGIFYMSAVSKQYKMPAYLGLTMFSVILYPYMWVYNAGTHGPVIFFYFFNACICAVLLSRFHFISMLMIHMLSVYSLIYYEYLHPEKMGLYKTLEARYLDIGFAFTLVFLMIFGLLITVMKAYNNSIDALKKTHEELEFAHVELKAIAETDALTSLYNRRFMMESLEACILNRCNAVLIMFDIDYFKSINDTFGHSVGDDVLRKVSAVLAGKTRHGDVVGRIGGEEFLVLLHETDMTCAVEMAELLRGSVEVMEWGHQGLNVTMSGGIYPISDNETLDHILEQVDQRLYEAKNEGRNQICGVSKKLA